jgi:hypothetical protein
MGLLQSRNELSFDFKGGNIRTEDISSTIPYLQNLNVQAKKLVGQLDTKINYNNKSLVLFNESDNFDMYKLFEKSTQSHNNNNFSETSPFISSDVYNQLLDNLKNKQSGGAKKSKSKKSKHSESESVSYKPSNDDYEEESSTSSESSESDEIFDSDKKKSKKGKHTIEKKIREHSEKDDMDIEPNKDDDEFSPMSHGMSIDSYVSSSAHSDNVSSEADDANTSSDNSLTMNSTVSFRKQHRNRHTYSESVNTSDINIISVD